MVTLAVVALRNRQEVAVAQLLYPQRACNQSTTANSRNKEMLPIQEPLETAYLFHICQRSDSNIRYTSVCRLMKDDLYA